MLRDEPISEKVRYTALAAWPRIGSGYLSLRKDWGTGVVCLGLNPQHRRVRCIEDMAYRLQCGFGKVSLLVLRHCSWE